MTENPWLNQSPATPYGFADPLAQAEIDRLRAQVAAVEALGRRLVWDRTVNKTAHVARLMLECVGVDPRQAMRERLGAPIPQVDPASLLRRIGNNPEESDV